MQVWLATIRSVAAATLNDCNQPRSGNMKTLYSIIIAGLLGFTTTVAYADDAATKPKAAKPQGGAITAAAPGAGQDIAAGQDAPVLEAGNRQERAPSARPS